MIGFNKPYLAGKELEYMAQAVGFNEGSGLIGKWITNKNTLK
jgi:hypothetical protein